MEVNQTKANQNTGFGNSNLGKNQPFQATTPTGYSTVPPKKSGSNVLLPIAIVIGLLLMGIIGYQAYQNSQTNRALEAKIAQLEEAENLRTEMEDQYNQAIAELEEMRGTNESLNQLIDTQKAEIEAQKNKLSKMIRNKKDLDNARSELALFKVQVDELVAQVATLQAENEQLVAQNEELQSNNSLLQENLNGQIAENSQLNEAKAVLISEKADLSKKVNIASVINVKNVKVEGYKMKGSKAVKKSSAKTIDQLKVCFTTVMNEVTQPGMETFYIRIINPIGETMAVEELGSGVIMDKKTGEEVPFTQIKEYNYANDEAELCFAWEPNMSFQRGEYQVEVYNKGHKSGMGKFTLK